MFPARGRRQVRGIRGGLPGRSLGAARDTRGSPAGNFPLCRADSGIRGPRWELAAILADEGVRRCPRGRGRGSVPDAPDSTGFEAGVRSPAGPSLPTNKVHAGPTARRRADPDRARRGARRPTRRGRIVCALAYWVSTDVQARGTSHDGPRTAAARAIGGDQAEGPSWGRSLGHGPPRPIPVGYPVGLKSGSPWLLPGRGPGRMCRPPDRHASPAPGIGPGRPCGRRGVDAGPGRSPA
jgi:hypothetical protein